MSHFCLVQELIKDKNFIDQTEEHTSLINYLDRFFQICKLTENIELIKIENIQSQCVLLVCENEYFVSVFNEKDAIMDCKIVYNLFFFYFCFFSKSDSGRSKSILNY